MPTHQRSAATTNTAAVPTIERSRVASVAHAALTRDHPACRGDRAGGREARLDCEGRGGGKGVLKVPLLGLF